MKVEEHKVKVFEKPMNVKAEKPMVMSMVVEENGICTLVLDGKPVLKELNLQGMELSMKKLYQFSKDCLNYR